LLQDLAHHLKNEEITQNGEQKKETDLPADTVAQTLAYGGDTSADRPANISTNTGNGGIPETPATELGNGTNSTALDLPPAAYREIIGRLEGGVQFLREALMREQENLQREQTLRAMGGSYNALPCLAGDTESDCVPVGGVVCHPMRRRSILSDFPQAVT
jgi:hypothetical protein